MKIQVTQEDIDRGQRYDGESCPIALAIARVRSDIKEIQITPYFAILGSRRCPLPLVARSFIWAFDIGDKPRTIEFDLEISE